MQTLESLQTSIDSASQMLSVVRTMKALAAINMRDYERAVQALALYNETIEAGLQIVLRDRPPVPATSTPPLAGERLGVIVFGSEQGLAGQFNERIAAFTLQHTADFDDDWQHRRVMAVGQRVTGHLIDGGLHVTEEAGVPGSLEAIQAAGRTILLQIDEWRTAHSIERIVLFYNTPTSSASYEPRQRWMLPVNPRWLHSLQTRAWESRALPLYTLSSDDLFSELIRQSLFVMLYRAFAESLASENASRLRSMQSAERNIDERLDDLRMQYRQRRQSAITDELLDIAAGFEALSDS